MAQIPANKAGGAKGQAAGLLIVRVCAGTFMVFFGLDKAGWLLDSRPLEAQLTLWLADAVPASRWYLERVLPGAPVFARVVPTASMIAGTALTVGFWTRMAAAVCLVTMLNLQLAAGAMFRYSYLSDAGGLPLVGALLALIIGGAKLPLSVRA